MSWSTPPFETQYGTWLGIATRALTELMLTIAPGGLPALTCATICLAADLPDQEHALQVDAQHAVEVGLRDVEEIRRVDDPGIVHQDVEIAVDAAGFRHDIARIARRADVGAHEARRAPERSGRRLAGALVDVRDDDARAFGDVAFGDRQPDAARPAGHDRGLSVEHAHRPPCPRLARGEKYQAKS